jgi:hypothetical protein
VSTGHQTEAERIVAQIRANAYEECAQIAEVVGSNHWAEYKRGAKRGDTYYDGAASGAHDVAYAIRKAAEKGGVE